MSHPPCSCTWLISRHTPKGHFQGQQVIEHLMLQTLSILHHEVHLSNNRDSTVHPQYQAIRIKNNPSSHLIDHYPLFHHHNGLQLHRRLLPGSTSHLAPQSARPTKLHQSVLKQIGSIRTVIKWKEEVVPPIHYRSKVEVNGLPQ